MALLQMHFQCSQQISLLTARQCPPSAILPLQRLPAASRNAWKPTQRSSSQLCCAVEAGQQQQQVQPEAAVPGMSAYLDSLRWAKDGLVPVIVQVRPDVHARMHAKQMGAAVLMQNHHQPGHLDRSPPPCCCCARSPRAPASPPATDVCQYSHFSVYVCVCVCAQHVDTGELLMQAYADRAALNETLQTK